MAKKQASVKVADKPFLNVRMNVSYIQNYPGGGQIVRLQAVDDLDGVNSSWSKGSPNGLMELDITNEDLHGQFKSGKTYEIAITATEAIVSPIS